MAFQDKSLQCSDCGATFTFGAEEQELFQSRGYAARQGSQSVSEAPEAPEAPAPATGSEANVRCSR